MGTPKQKRVLRLADKSLGQPMRSLLRSLIVHPLITANFKVEIEGGEAALSCPDGAIIISNHISALDAVVLMSEAWPYARIWPTAWHQEYYNPWQRPFMWLFSAVPLGSSSHLPPEHRAKIRLVAMDIMNRILRAGRHLLIFAEGGIGDGKAVLVKRTLTGVHDLIRDNPSSPILMVKIRGLEFSASGKQALPWYRRVFRRLPVKITIERYDNVSLAGGHEALNERIEEFYTRGLPL